MAALPNTPDPEPEETEDRHVDDRETDADPAGTAAQEDGGAARDAVTEGGSDGSIERRIEELVDERVTEVERQLAELEAELEELDDFARISLGERYSQRIEQNVSELSDSLTGFAERNFRKMNSIERRVDEMSLLLTAVIEALDEDVDIDFTEVRRMQDDGVVDRSPEDRLEAASRGE